MKRDINIFWYLIPIALIVIGSATTDGFLHAMLIGGGFFAIGMACLSNFRKCGRVHCVVTGPILIVLSLLVFLVFFEVLTINDSILNAILIGGLVAGFGVEFLYRRKHGTCYIKMSYNAGAE